MALATELMAKTHSSLVHLRQSMRRLALPQPTSIAWPRSGRPRQNRQIAEPLTLRERKDRFLPARPRDHARGVFESEESHLEQREFAVWPQVPAGILQPTFIDPRRARIAVDDGLRSFAGSES
jgi:hypothetical protein